MRLSRLRLISSWLARFARDERAQATTEYILMMSIIVTMLVGLIKKLIQPAFEKLTTILKARIQGMFKPQALHRLNMGGR